MEKPGYGPDAGLLPHQYRDDRLVGAGGHDGLRVDHFERRAAAARRHQYRVDAWVGDGFGDGGQPGSPDGTVRPGAAPPARPGCRPRRPGPPGRPRCDHATRSPAAALAGEHLGHVEQLRHGGDPNDAGLGEQRR